MLAVSHLIKAAGGPAIYRTMGSLAFVAASRAAFVVVKDADAPERRLLLPQKNNLAEDTGGLAYTVASADSGVGVIDWESGEARVSMSSSQHAPGTVRPNASSSSTSGVTAFSRTSAPRTQTPGALGSLVATTHRPRSRRKSESPECSSAKPCVGNCSSGLPSRA